MRLAFEAVLKLRIVSKKNFREDFDALSKERRWKAVEEHYGIQQPRGTLELFNNLGVC